MAKKIIKEIKILLGSFLRNISGPIGWRLRHYHYHKDFKEIGKRVSFSESSYIRGAKNISIGNDVGFGIFTQIYCDEENDGGEILIGNDCNFNSNVIINADNGGKIEIGDNVIIGPNVVFRASNHNYDISNSPTRYQGHKSGKIIIENNVWIGANVVILPNVRVSEGSVIAAGSVINKDIPKKKIAGGVPAKIIRSI